MRLEDKILTLLWAKKKDVAGQFVWLPLLVHLQDTMGVMQFLWHHWVSEGQKQTIIHSLSPIKMDAEDAAYNLACFLAGVHDIGRKQMGWMPNEIIFWKSEQFVVMGIMKLVLRHSLPAILLFLRIFPK